MADITMCRGCNCPFRMTCYRHVARVNPYRQSVADYWSRATYTQCDQYMSSFETGFAQENVSRLMKSDPYYRGADKQIEALAKAMECNDPRSGVTEKQAEIISEAGEAMRRKLMEDLPPETPVRVNGDDPGVARDYIMWYDRK